MTAILVIGGVLLIAVGWIIWPFLWAKLKGVSRPDSSDGPRPRTVVHNHGVLRIHPDGTTESIEWTELERVNIITTSAGPWGEDFYWVLHGIDGVGCIVPSEDPSAESLLESMEQLDSFDYQAVIRACGSTTEAEFLCWQRS